MNVFESAYADGYDLLYRDKDYVAECDLVERLLRTSSEFARAASILDIGCGTGGHAIELARRGYRIEGLDRSEAMLEQARRKAGQTQGLTMIPHFSCGDARNFTSSAPPFDAALMMFAVIGYLTSNDDLAEALSRVAVHLKPGGAFVFDCWWGPAVLTQRPSERVRVVPTSTGKLLRVARTSLDTCGCVADVRFDLFHLNQSGPPSESSETHRIRYFFGPELELLLKNAGLRLERLGQFPQWDAEPDDGSWNVMGIARKPTS